MRIQVNTQDGAGGADLIASIQQAVAAAVQRYERQLTRVEVHLSDTNALKGGTRNKSFMVEARPTGKAPVAVTHQAPSMPKAMHGALDKLGRVLDTALAERAGSKGQPSLRDSDLFS